MASTSTSKQRRLLELLEEEQEPFELETYLHERGCSRRISSEFEGPLRCFSSPNHRNSNLSNVLKRSKSWSNYNNHDSNSGQLSIIAKSVYSKIVLGLKSSTSKRSKRRNEDDKQVVVMESQRSSSSSASSFLEIAAHHEAAMTQWRFIEENKQCSPVSVLDEIDFLPVYNNNNNTVRVEEGDPSSSSTRFHKKVSEDSILSASLFELLVDARRSKLPLQMNSKKALQQTRQLLFDCVREVVEMGHKGKEQLKRMRRKQRGLVMGAEQIGNIICHNLKAWGKFSTDKFSDSTQEWGSFEVYTRDVAWDIGDAILQQITDDVVKDLIHQY